ncbi:MAG: hypothetical protein CVV64_14545 [Candidatus Wallbacteria bacterium HGW-Wallbacteria-1]|jgi:hypothetical protein|uniref:Uncharacterized protein n=1 Tax=Candidatus Wallbacteria bacterium HGW-Wallbacteria-1 TaxID=2013854 RepID=A0A2N1PLY2_9BACT|nr:MAG: hypothetical protein CVV64_14545 [Candidatus Wallbacteria bacterium HGW-Wallbacteria-1]
MNHYTHLKDQIIAFFTKGYCISPDKIVIEPLKRDYERLGIDYVNKSLDLVGVDDDGDLLIAEIKNYRESKESVSSWWSWWKKHHQIHDRYSNEVNSCKGNIKGWIAAIDGQLKDYCIAYETDTGFLILEGYSFFDENVTKACELLENEIDIEFELTVSKNDIGFLEVTYNQ